MRFRPPFFSGQRPHILSRNAWLAGAALLPLLFIAHPTIAAPVVEKAAPADKKAAPETPDAAPKAATKMVTITVLGPDDKPVADARLWVWSWGEVSDSNNIPKAHRATTDAKGMATLELPLGKARAVDADGAFGGVAVVATGLAIKFENLKSETTLHLARGGVVRGQVVDSNGKAIEGATVGVQAVIQPNNNRGGYVPISIDPDLAAMFRAKSDAEGRFSIADLPLESRATLELQDDRFARGVATAAIKSADVKAGVPATVDAESTLTARPAASISGRIVGEDGKALGDMKLNIRRTGEENNFGIPREEKTGADGTFRIGRLAAGEQTISVLPPLDGEWTAATQTLSISEGQNVTTPDLVLSRGAIIQGRVVDAADGSGLAGAMLMTQGTNNATYRSVQTDAKGNFKMRVAPGKARVILSTPPADYLPSETATYQSPLIVEVAKGDTKSVEIKLKKGVAFKGIAVDEKGAALVGAIVSLSTDGHDNWRYSNQKATSEKGGAFKISGLKEGNWTLNGDDEWEILSPKTVSLPQKEAVRVVARRLPFLKASGRVVTPEGKPVAGATVNAQIMVKRGDTNYGNNQTAVSEADGRWTVEKVPGAASAITVSISKSGHSFVKAGEVKKVADKWVGDDTILKPLTGRIAGRIVDDKNAPAAGIKVLSPDGGTVAVTDEQGRFALQNLNDGEITLVAIGTTGAATTHVRVLSPDAPANDDFKLALKPMAPPAEHDYDRARALLDDAWQTSKGRNFWQRASLPAELARFDPDDALALAQGEEKETSWTALKSIIMALALSKNPADIVRAATWAPDKLVNISHIGTRVIVASALGRAVLKTQPELTQKLLDQARGWAEGVKAGKNDKLDWNGWSALAQLGAALKSPLADGWFAKALALVKNGDSSQVGQLAIEAAEVRADWAEQAIEAAKASDATAQKYSPKSGYYAAQAVRRLIPIDMAGAKRLYDKYSAVKDDMSTWQWTQADVDFAVAKAHVDLEAGIKAAHDLDNNYQPRALAQIAEFAPAERATALLQEAVKFNESRFGDYNSPLRIAALLRAHDDKAGRAAIQAMRTQLESADANPQMYNQGRNVAAVAFALRDIDAMGARLLIEREWARQKQGPATPNDEWTRNRELSDLAFAMAPLDAERATEMAWQIPIDAQGGDSFRTLARIARWMLASKAERETQNFGWWNKSLTGEDRGDDGTW